MCKNLILFIHQRCLEEEIDNNWGFVLLLFLILPQRIVIINLTILGVGRYEMSLL